jgi:hypothetical protein
MMRGLLCGGLFLEKLGGGLAVAGGKRRQAAV